MTSPGLPDFLLARIADDENAAKRAAFGYGAGWTSETDDGEDWSVVHASGQRDMVGCEDGDVTRHIARHDPARVLAECDAKRRIVANAQAYRDGESGFGASQYAMQCLALAYADHPNYNRAEWRP